MKPSKKLTTTAATIGAALFSDLPNQPWWVTVTIGVVAAAYLAGQSWVDVAKVKAAIDQGVRLAKDADGDGE